MKRAILAATALLSTSFTPFTAANASTYAQSANPPSAADMQNVCDTKYDTDGAGTNYQVIMTQGAVDYGALTFDTSTITDDESTRVADHSSSSTPYGTKSFYSMPGRHGGSPNLFATIGYPGITYAGSFVDQNADRTETDTYHFSCQLQHWEVVGQHEEGVPGTPVQGYYVNCDFGHGQGHDNGGAGVCDETGQPQGSCAAHNNQGSSWEHWGEDTEQCKFIVTAPAVPDSTELVDDYGWVNSGDAYAETLTDGPYYVDTVLYASHVSEPAVPVTETDAPPYFAGDVVVCISPGKKGGTWTGQNGWTNMTKCTTTYFNTAPYISGANVFHSNSLPPL